MTHEPMSVGDSDRLFAHSEAAPGSFRFDADVARIFADMIVRSVPGYAETIALTGRLAGRFGRNHTHLYDLGCALGATLVATLHTTADLAIEATGIDASAPMLNRCRDCLSALELPRVPTLLEADIRDVEYTSASFIALNWTLQFIPVSERTELLRRIHAALVPGGALVLSEKVLHEDPDQQALLEHLHLDYKRAQGYSEHELTAKRLAIEGVLVPETLSAHHRRLTEVGFGTIVPVARTLNFATLLAVRA